MNTSTNPKIQKAQIENLPISKITGLQSALDNINPTPDPYVHPTQSSINVGPLTGAQVISEVKVNNLGHTTQVSTRNITASNIGAQPLGNYEVTANKSTNTSLGNSDILYPTQRAVKTYVDATKNTIQAVTINTGTGLQGGGNLSANRTFSVTDDVLRESNNNVISGLKEFRRFGPNNGSADQTVVKYSIDSGSLHLLELFNTQNVDAPDGEVQWGYKYTSDVGSAIAKTRDMLGFARGAVTILGGRALPASQYSTIVTAEGNNSGTPSYRYPLTVYSYGINQIEDGLIVGTDAVRVSKIDADTKVYLEGGIRTTAPVALGAEATVKFGSYTASASNTVDILWRVKVGDKVIDILGREVV